MSDDTRKNPGIKIPFLDINKPLVEGTRCVEILIPDDPEYMPVLAGLVSIATKWFNYQRDDTHKGTQLAKMWQNAYRLTDWEQCMTCEDVENCIETDEGVQDALQQNLIDNINNSTSVQNALQQIIQQQIAAQNPVADSGENLAYGVEDCDNDKTWGMADVLVEWLNINNIDFFERLVVATTPAARGAAMSKEIPGWSGGALGELASAVVTFFSGTLKANYEAFYDTAYADALKCEIWCLASINCSITLDNLYALFSSRIGVTPVPFYEGVVLIATGTWTGTQFADVAMFLQISAFKFMGGFAGLLGINPIQNAIAEGYNNGSSEWDDCDCAPPWCIRIDSTNGLDTLFFATGPLGAQAVWTGTGWARNDAVASARITIGIDLGAAYNMTSIRVVNSVVIDNGDTNTKNLLDYPSFTVMFTEPATADTIFELGVLPVQKFAIDCISDIDPDGAPVPGEIIAVYLFGVGTPPDIASPCNEYIVPATADPALDQYDTGFDVVMGTEYHLVASGTWDGGTGISYDANGNVGTTNPAAYLPASAIYCLMYRIGAGAWTYAGADLTFTPGSSGRLYLAMNDVPGAYSDNSGELIVSISET